MISAELRGLVQTLRDRASQLDGPARSAAVAFASSRLALFVVAYLALVVVPYVPLNGQWRAFPSHPSLDGWARWDSGWYASIALEGYSYRHGQPSNVNFFPLYPLLSLVAGYPFRAFLTPNEAFYVGGMLVSFVAFAFGVAGAHRLAREWTSPEVAARVVWLLCLFPFSYFHSAVYTESLFLALTTWAMVYARKGRWWHAGVLAALASTTRIPGVLIGMALAIEYMDQRKFSVRAIRADALGVVMGMLGFAGMLTYFGVRFGKPFVFRETQQEVWQRTTSLLHVPWAISSVLHDPSMPWVHRLSTSVHVVLLPIAVGLAVYVLVRINKALGVYGLLSIALVYSTGTEGAGRYLSVHFELFIAAAIVLRSRWALVTAIVLSIALLVVFLSSFARWGFPA